MIWLAVMFKVSNPHLDSFAKQSSNMVNEVNMRKRASPDSNVAFSCGLTLPLQHFGD